MRRLLYILLISTLSLAVNAKDTFTAAEQQQISIQTPGLFGRSDKFQIDFTQTRNNEFAFPLPVGKVTGMANNIVEIETKAGDAVKAMFDGTVRLSKQMPNFGHTVVVRHNNGLETVYALNAQNLVKVGDRVKAGQTLAIVGTRNGKAMLQFFIMVDGRRINPSTILDINGHSLHKQIVTVKNNNGKISVKTSHTAEQIQKKAEKEQTMSLDSNDPFQGKSVYRLNLDLIHSGEWHYPLQNAKVISGYGGKRRHSGVDIKNGPGNDVYAAFDGLVVQSGVFSGYGKCITIRHANGLETRYSHNSKNYVTVGEKVKAGQVIGVVGRTGRATTEHVHFETRIAGKAFDPAYVFDHANNCLQKGTLQFKKNGGVSRLK